MGVNSTEIAMNFFIYGGNEQSTHKYVTELLGKETIDLNTHAKSTGRNGNYSTNYQIGGRELMTPDEVRLLNNKYAILFIRGEKPIMDFKYDILKHPNVALTTDGKAKPYKHGKTDRARATIALNNENIQDENYIDVSTMNDIQELEQIASDYELITSEEYIERFFNGGF